MRECTQKTREIPALAAIAEGEALAESQTSANFVMMMVQEEGTIVKLKGPVLPATVLDKDQQSHAQEQDIDPDLIETLIRKS